MVRSSIQAMTLARTKKGDLQTGIQEMKKCFNLIELSSIKDSQTVSNSFLV